MMHVCFLFGNSAQNAQITMLHLSVTPSEINIVPSVLMTCVLSEDRMMKSCYSSILYIYIRIAVCIRWVECVAGATGKCSNKKDRELSFTTQPSYVFALRPELQLIYFSRFFSEILPLTDSSFFLCFSFSSTNMLSRVWRSSFKR